MHPDFLIAAVLAFGGFGGLWLYRRLQLVAIQEQRAWCRIFCDEVRYFRLNDAPQHARDLVEQLAKMPVDAKLVRLVGWRMLMKRVQPGSTEPGEFLRTLRSLPPKQAAAFARIIVFFFYAFTAADWLFGRLIRFLLRELDQETQAEVVIETVAAYP
jgi:hypothetical protein